MLIKIRSLLRLKGKLLVTMILAALLPLSIASVVISSLAGFALENKAASQLESVRAIKQEQIENYFSQIRNQIAVFSENTMIIEAMKGFRAAFRQWPTEVELTDTQLSEYQEKVENYYRIDFANEYKNRVGKQTGVAEIVPADRTTILAQYHYIANNENELGSKEKLDLAGDGSTYSQLHAKYHPIIRNYLEKFGYYDIFLLDPNTGEIVYSVFKELDYATSLKTGPYKDTNFARAFDKAVAAEGGTSIFLEDFATYFPSYDGAASFIAAPIYDEGVLQGVIVFQMPVGKINEIMQRNEGMGESGETYLLGSDFLMRSQSRFIETNTLLETRIDTQGAKAIFTGETGTSIFPDYRGVEVMSAYAPLSMEDLNWGILAEIDKEEALQDINSLYLAIAIISVVATCLIAIVAFVFARKMANRVSAASEVASSIAAGNFDNEIISDTSDEIGEMLSSLEVMQGKLKTQIENERRQGAENNRIRQALDNVSANVIVADANLDIIYINQAVEEMFRNNETVLQREFTDFHVDELIGKNIDIFHQDPSYQRGLLNNLNDTHSAEINISGLIFNIIANPVLSEDGERLGTVVEWTDLTEQRDAEQQVERVIQAAVAGQLSTRLDTSRFQGFMKTLSEGVNQMLDAIINPLTVAADYVDRIAKGDIPEPITEEYRGDFNQIKNNLNTCITAINRLVEDADMLANATVHGELATRADSSHHQGDFRKIVEGVNNTLDAVINPLTVAADYVDRIAKGDIPEPITEEYRGDFNQIKNNLNTCITAINQLVEDANMLANAAVHGELATRADSSHHQGDFRKIVEGVNNTLDAIITPVNECKETMGALAKGDLSQKMQGHFQGEFAILSTSVNTSMGNLSSLVRDIREAAQNINTSATEIAKGNTDLSQRTEMQASSLEETASSLQELTGTVKQNADNTNSANELAISTREQAELGGSVVTQAVTAVDEINDSSTKIANIIGVIDEIAFQTNLLALNAAVEAARAGEQGRGFAVVASEVRNLAQRSAEAAKDIKALINDSVGKVQTGSTLVNESGETLEKIVSSVKKVNNLIAEIATASDEQSTGINQVNKAVSQMDEMTQQNAALVEESAAVSKSMEHEAQRLMELMESFTINIEDSENTTPTDLKLVSGA